MECSSRKGFVEGEKVFRISNYGETTEVRVRNVGKLNPDEQIQFSIQQWKEKPNARTKYISFSIPASYAKEFIDTITKTK